MPFLGSLFLRRLHRFSDRKIRRRVCDDSPFAPRQRRNGDCGSDGIRSSRHMPQLSGIGGFGFRCCRRKSPRRGIRRNCVASRKCHSQNVRTDSASGGGTRSRENFLCSKLTPFTNVLLLWTNSTSVLMKFANPIFCR